MSKPSFGAIPLVAAGLTRAIRRLLSQPVEDRLSLRLVVLGIAWWVALSLAWVGGLGWMGFVGVALDTAGHAVSWQFRTQRVRFSTALIGVGVAGTLALVPRTVAHASTGDWVSVAQFLLLFQGITSFELRSRAGLYTAVGMSGAILFLVSQRALDPGFGVFLTGFTALLLSFLAVSSLVDQVSGAEVRWLRGRLSFAWLWTCLFAVLMAVSAGVFVLMPKHLGGQIDHAEASVLPIRGSGTFADAPDMVQDPSALPLRRSDIDWSMGSRDESSGPAPALEADGAPTVTAVDTPEVDVTASDPTAAPSASADPATAEERGSSDRSLVMRVRSPVLTYWRG